MPDSLLDLARSYVVAGLSVIPIASDGTKAPDGRLLPKELDERDGIYHATWRPFQARRATDTELRRWFGLAGSGIAVIGGAVSGGLEVIDFDEPALYEQWLELVRAETWDLVARLTVVRSPRGFHVYTRGPVAAGNTKLAEGPDPSRPKGRKTLIETRGEGGYVLAPGCPPACHSERRLYEHVEGPGLTDVQTITAADRLLLWTAARSFQQVAEPGLAWDRPPASGASLRPGDDYNRRAGWPEALGTGWVAVRSRGDVNFWRRPGKEDKGWSATTGYCKNEKQEDLLYVFSASAAPFEPGRAYTRFGAYTLLNHAGDYKAAARALAGMGYGTPSSPRHAPGQRTGSVAGNSAADTPSEVLPDIRPDDVATIHDLMAAGSRVQWLWPDWIPTGVLTAIAAPGGTGKTRFCADLLRRIRQGVAWPDGQAIESPPESLALWVVADNHHDEMVTLSHAFAVVDNVRINATRADPFGGVSLETADDLRDFESRVKAVRPAMVVIDTVGNATDKNLSRQEDAKAFYAPLQLIARKYRTAILCLTHLNAGGTFLGRRVMEKVRVAIRMDQFDPPDGKRRLEVVKSNSKRPAALGVLMGDSANDYDFDPPEPPSTDPNRPGPVPAKVKEAADWLAAQLARGAVRVKNLIDGIKAAGLSVGTLYRAKELAGAVEFEADGRKYMRLAADGIPP